MTLKQLWEKGGYKEYPTDKQTGHTYLDYYDDLFLPYKNKKIGIFEVGYAEGGSLRLWEDYFLKAQLISIDVNDEHLPEGATELIKISDRSRFDKINIRDISPDYFNDFPVDIAIDDGSHIHTDQLLFVRLMYPIVREGGLVIIEDFCDAELVKPELDKLGYPYEIIDLRYMNDRWDNMLVIFRK